MTVLYYILIGMFSALLLAGAAVVVFKKGEKELICKYDNIGEETKH